jgi:hypothetical protein
MSLTPTVNPLGRNGHNTRLIQYKYTIPTVGTSATGDEQTLANFPAKGIIKQVKVTSASTDFDLSLKDKAAGVAGSNNEIFQVTGINLHYDESGLEVNFRNADTALTRAIYAKIKNDDGGNATGSTLLELFVEIPDEE